MQQTNSFSQNPEFESVQNSTMHNQFAPGILRHSEPVSFQNTMSGGGTLMMSGNLNFDQKESGMSTQKTGMVEEHWQNLIDWVNSFNDPYCLLVSQFEDFSDGITLCHLVSLVVCNDSDQLQMKQLVHYDTNGMGIEQTKKIQNIDLALNVLKASTAALPDSVQNDLTAEDLQTNQLKCYLFIETLR